MGICGQRVTNLQKRKMKKIQEDFGGYSRIVCFKMNLENFRGRNFKTRDSKFVISFGSNEKLSSKMIHNSINPSVILKSSKTTFRLFTDAQSRLCVNRTW